MHKDCYDFVARFATENKVSLIDIGSRNINGTVRPLFPNAEVIGIDLYPGPDVDVVDDAVTWRPERLAEYVTCCEVLEHTSEWPAVIMAASEYLTPGGTFILTCAGPGRLPHSHVDGGALRENEYYGNIALIDLMDSCECCGLIVEVAEYLPQQGDCRIMAKSPLFEVGPS